MEPVEIPGEVVIERIDANCLGIGSYGAVYKAKIGQLPCAAKILHPTLFHVGDPGSDRMRTLFEQECHVLRRIRHPHVIQYIKSYQDEESQLPVLLMELMDESLTHYLEENLRSPVPHHVRLNISHDIALALEFLHSINVLHRDLSSNNVLLMAGKRAKVTDFGMAKVWDGNTHMTPATFCPGTTAYMPPEAFRAEGTYTDRLDCFSAGVVFLQILTRRFPTPMDRVRQVTNDERYPTGIEVINPERDRRQDDISRVPQDEPLLLIALDCIHDKAFMRPSAREICGRIEALKSTSWSEYVAEQERREIGGVQRLRHDGEEEVENHIDVGQIHELEEQLKDSQAQLLEAQLCLDETQRELRERELEISELRDKLVKNDREHREIIEKFTESIREKQEMLMIRGNPYELEQAEELVAVKDTRIAELARQVSEYQEELQRANHLSLPLQEGVVPRAHSASDILSLPSHSPSSPGANPLELKWRLCGTARKIEGNSSAVFDSGAYFTDGNSVLMFNSVTGEWTTLPPCPKRSFAVSVVGGLPTAIGGYMEQEGNVGSLLSLSGEGHSRCWQKTYPSMKFSRTCPAAMVTGNILVVAGGYGLEENGRCVEVLNTSTMSWSVSVSLPFPFWRASIVACGNQLYLGGGVKEGKPLGCPDILYCSLTELQSTSHHSTSFLPVHKKLRHFRFSSSSNKLWHTAAKLPVILSTLVSFQSSLYAVGGQTSDKNMPVSDVFCYSSSSNEWVQCGRMVKPRSRCFVVALPNNQLMALGGSVEPYSLTDSIEMTQQTNSL